MGAQVFDKGFNFVMAIIKGVLWLTAAVVYAITLVVNGEGAALFEYLFCFVIIALGGVMGVLNFRKVPRLRQEFKDIRAENAAYKAAQKAAAADAKVDKTAKGGDWPDLHE